MTENGVVTLFRPAKNRDGLLCLGTFSAWVYHEKIIRNDDGGVYRNDYFDIRIKKDYIEDIEIGDLVYFGRAESGCVKTAECCRVASVILNDSGSVPHWHLGSDYRYR